MKMKISLFCLAIATGLLAGCEARVGHHYAGPEASIAVYDDYVYYPAYQVYYSSNRRQYIYREGPVWVIRPVPTFVSVNALAASPSVRLNFHDSPARHHSRIVRQYPRQWDPSYHHR